GGVGRFAGYDNRSVPGIARPVARAFCRRDDRGTCRRQQRAALDAGGHERLGRIDFRYPDQVGLLRDHGGAVRRRLVVESQFLSVDARGSRCPTEYSSYTAPIALIARASAWRNSFWRDSPRAATCLNSSMRRRSTCRCWIECTRNMQPAPRRPPCRLWRK